MNKHVRNIGIIFVIVIILELTIFNINSYRVLNSKKSRTFSGEKISTIETEKDTFLYSIYDINEEIKTIHIKLKNDDITTTYEISCSDETSENPYQLPHKVYISDFESSKYIATFLSRKN